MQLLEFKQFKTQFFYKKVVDASARQAKKVLSRFGAYVRQTARQLIRRRRRSSRPGEPPTNQTGLLRDYIFFGYDDVGQGVLIGPALLHGRKGTGDNAEKLQALEYGGVTEINQKRINLRPRPFMQPAYDENEKKLPEIWQQFPLT